MKAWVLTANNGAGAEPDVDVALLDLCQPLKDLGVRPGKWVPHMGFGNYYTATPSQLLPQWGQWPIPDALLARGEEPLLAPKPNGKPLAARDVAAWERKVARWVKSHATGWPPEEPLIASVVLL